MIEDLARRGGWSKRWSRRRERYRKNVVVASTANTGFSEDRSRGYASSNAAAERNSNGTEIDTVRR